MLAAASATSFGSTIGNDLFLPAKSAAGIFERSTPPPTFGSVGSQTSEEVACWTLAVPATARLSSRERSAWASNENRPSGSIWRAAMLRGPLGARLLLPRTIGTRRAACQAALSESWSPRWLGALQRGHRSDHGRVRYSA